MRATTSNTSFYFVVPTQLWHGLKFSETLARDPSENNFFLFGRAVDMTNREHQECSLQHFFYSHKINQRRNFCFTTDNGEDVS